MTDPDGNAIYAIAAVALSLYVFAYSVRLGQISILAFYAVWFLPVALAPRILLRNPAPILVLSLLPVAFLLSTAWSDVPSVTLRSAIQYATTIFCGIVAARMVSVPNLALGGTLGGLAVLVYSAMNGSYSYDYVDGSYAFQGAFASKNQLGYFATLTMIFALGLLAIYRTHFVLWPLAVGAMGMAVWLLLKSDSATSLLSAGAAFAAIFMVRGLFALERGLRFSAICLLLSATAGAALAAFRAGVFDAVLAAFGKDSTLTGRTYLWNQAIEIGARNPTFGLGYNAFWTHGRPEAEQLWEEFFITGRTGFHFHNLLIESYVALGILGLILVGGICVLLVAMPITAILQRRGTGSVMICSGLSLLFLVRSGAEVDFITAYTAGSFLVSFVIVHLFDHVHIRTKTAGWRGAQAGTSDLSGLFSKTTAAR
ncbi:O-antigen ligase family protein [Palleronia sp. THAF1]|uniref:O-antigen ligase family protein n=1 Tax=Palleronia sp. THAF1 TaxID=2587842 RepID=UPI000F536492|nr:O-antigen ligase [Palleronia sp. THAF1]